MSALFDYHPKRLMRCELGARKRILIKYAWMRSKGTLIAIEIIQFVCASIKHNRPIRLYMRFFFSFLQCRFYPC